MLILLMDTELSREKYYLFTNEENPKENHHVEELAAHGENSKPQHKLRADLQEAPQTVP